MRHDTDTPLQLGLAAASALLAIAPIEWLIASWRDPAYQSNGVWYFAILLGLVAWSLQSGRAREAFRPEGLIWLFALAACTRLAGQLLAINILGALALAVDVFAIARWLRLDSRPNALSPLWLALFFLFAMPLAPILERVLGFPLQIISADLACRMLAPFFGDLVCEGVRLRVGGVDVLVDLPCSGASGLLLMLSLWTFLNVLYRPSLWDAAFGGLKVLLCALLGNAFRISLLAGGLALGIDTMEPMLHEAIGLVSLAFTAAPILLFYRPAPAPIRRLPLPPLPDAARLPAVAIAIGLSLAVVNAPRTPLDRSAPVAQAALPAQLLGHPVTPVALSETEAAYFATYGGTAHKAQYGPLGLNIVRTASPLRHLHSPATCLLGMGFDVRFLGTRFDPLPTSVYQATGPDGQVWHVAVSFISGQGHATPSVGEAVWSWLSGATGRWQSVQRITPAGLSPESRAAFEAAALASLDL